MRLQLKDVEPYRIPPTDESDSVSFMRRLAGNESFDFPSSQRPKSVVFFSLTYAYPRKSTARGWLVSCDVDGFVAQLGANDLEAVLARCVLGELEISYGGDLPATSVKAKPGRWKRS